MSGILAAGGSVDKFFNFARGTIGEASVSLQGWFTDTMKLDTDGTTINSILEAYTLGLGEGAFKPFGGVLDPNYQTTLDYIAAKVPTDKDFIYKCLSGLFIMAQKGDSSSIKVLAGDGGSFVSGVTRTLGEGLSDTLSGFAKALGISPTIFYIIVVVVLVVGAAYAYRTFKK